MLTATHTPLLRGLKAMLMREWWINVRAYRVSFFAAVFMNSWFSIIFGYFMYVVIFKGQLTNSFVTAAGTTDYMSYLTLGVLVYTFMYRMLYPVRNFLYEHLEGTLTPVLLTGVPRLLYHLGCVLFSSCYSVVEVGVLVLATLTFVRLDLSSIHPLGTVVGLLGTFVGLYGFSLLMSVLIVFARDRNIVEGAMFALTQLLSGVLFPVTFLPGPLQWFSNLFPLTWALKVLRAAVLRGAAPQQMLPDLVVLLSLGIGYTLIGKVLLDKALANVAEETA